jgi:hypothetical protein
VQIAVRDHVASITASREQGGGIRFDVPITNRRATCVTFQGKVRRGNATIAVYSGTKGHFWHFVPRMQGKYIVTDVFIPEADIITIYVYADEPVEFEFDRIKMIQSEAVDYIGPASLGESVIV